MDRPPISVDEVMEQSMGGLGWTQVIQVIMVSMALVFDGQQTFIIIFTDHSIDSASSFMKGLSKSAFFIGCLIGGFLLSTLADSFLGRKKMLGISCLVMSVSGFLSMFSPNIWVYACLRFLNGFARATIGTTAIVLSTELVGKNWRGQVGNLGFFFDMLGYLSLPVLGYLNRGKSWKNMYMWTSIPAFIYSCIVLIFCFESPRWLLLQGRREDAITVITRLSSRSTTRLEIATIFSAVPEQEEQRTFNIYKGIQMLFLKPWALKRIGAVMAISFGIGLVYFGMPLALTSLPFNLYLSTGFTALMDLPANLIAICLIGQINRRTAVIVFTALGGLSSVLIYVAKRIGQKTGDFQIALELISYFSACTAFNILMIYIIELFPTSVRNSGIALARQALVLAGICSPVLVSAGRETGLWSFGIFGIAIGVLGLFAAVLPETRGRTLSDTIEEEESRN